MAHVVNSISQSRVEELASHFNETCDNDNCWKCVAVKLANRVLYQQSRIRSYRNKEYKFASGVQAGYYRNNFPRR